MALAVEVSELMEIFQWLTETESRDLAEEESAAVAQEMADVLIYLVRLADVCDVDLLNAAAQKMQSNAAKYPAKRVRGHAKKYSEHD